MEVFVSVVGGTILGWLLGILSQPIASRVLRYYRRKDLMQVVYSELSSLAFKSAVAVVRVDMHLNKCDKATFEAVKEVIKKYDRYSFGEGLDHLKRLDFTKYQALITSTKTATSQKMALKKYSLKLLESSVDELSALDQGLQKDILFILDRVNILNEEVSLAMDFFRLTFSSLPPDNVTIISQNLQNSYRVIRDMNFFITEEADRALEAYY